MPSSKPGNWVTWPPALCQSVTGASPASTALSVPWLFPATQQSVRLRPGPCPYHSDRVSRGQRRHAPGPPGPVPRAERLLRLQVLSIMDFQDPATRPSPMALQPCELRSKSGKIHEPPVCAHAVSGKGLVTHTPKFSIVLKCISAPLLHLGFPGAQGAGRGRCAITSLHWDLPSNAQGQ